MPMGAATMAYVLWTRHLRHNPKNPEWPDRDRFVLSAGHASMLLYSMLFLTGYDLAMEEIEQFRQWESRTPGHPENGRTPGVEVTTGPLGQGLANSVGLAIAERWLAATFNRKGDNVVDHYTYVLASDGDMMEGVAAEAASLAGRFQLGRLIVLYDANLITLSATTNITFSLFSRVRDTARRVKRWMGGMMILRWTAAGVLEAERHFRKVAGYRALPKLVAALRAHDAAIDRDRRVANAKRAA